MHQSFFDSIEPIILAIKEILQNTKFTDESKQDYEDDNHWINQKQV